MHSIVRKFPQFAITGGQGRKQLYLYEVVDPRSVAWAKVSDTIRDEQQKSMGDEGTGQIQQPVQKDFGGGDVSEQARGGGEGGGAVVPRELGRVPGALDTKLSAEESAAFEPERQALAAATFGTPEHLAAFRAMRDKVIQRFQPLLDALGVRWDSLMSSLSAIPAA